MGELVTEEMPRKARRKITVGRVIAAGLLVCGLFAVVVVWQYSTVPFDDDPNLVRTTRPTRSLANSGLSLPQELFWNFYEWKRARFPKPSAYTFPATGGPTSCSIHGLLNQCMEVGGTQYLIERSVASGSVDFGSTNILNGQQWVSSFEHALQSGSPQWWDAESKGFRKESVVFLRYDSRTVLVLSEETAREYQERHPKLRPLR